MVSFSCDGDYIFSEDGVSDHRYQCSEDGSWNITPIPLCVKSNFQFIFCIVWFRAEMSDLFNYELHCNHKYLTGSNWKQKLLTRPHTLTLAWDFDFYKKE